MTKLVECVPNVSEGRDHKRLEALSAAVSGVTGVQLLDVDPGADTHRTVFTFVGEPTALLEAAWRFVEKATQLIDMRLHHGAHPRLGAVDVVPFVPVGGGATMDDCVALARQLGARIGRELGVPVFLYERAATTPARQSLADIRQGEYEGLAEKLRDPLWKPDFGPATFVPASGATVVGARPFLIAYNINLNSSDQKLAHEIALTLREQGRSQRGPDGKLRKDASGQTLKQPGRLKAVRAVGWHIPEFGRAQISMNLLDYQVTPPHIAFDAAREEARALGVRITGSELVGLVPQGAMLQAGRHYLSAQGKTPAVPEPDLIAAARLSLGLDDVKPFDPAAAIIERRLAPRPQGLAALTVTAFADEVSRATPAPGGGSVAAQIGSVGAALAAMVAALTHGSTTSAPEATRLVDLGSRAQRLKDELLLAIDRDSAAFDQIVAARRLPKKSAEQIAARQAAIQLATRAAIDVPLGVVIAAAEVAELALEVATHGMAAAASDAGVAAWSARAAAEGAALNVRINLPGLTDGAERAAYAAQLSEALDRARRQVEQALAVVERNVGGQSES